MHNQNPTRTRKWKYIVGSFLAMLTLVLVCILPVRSADEIEGDHIVIDGTAYALSGTENLVNANLALIRWNAEGNSTEDEDSVSKITGVFNDQEVFGYWAVYEELYKLLLDASEDLLNQTTKSIEVGTNEIVIYRLCMDSNAKYDYYHIGYSHTISGGTLILLADDATDARTTDIGRFTISDGGTLVIQGRSDTQKISLKSKDSSTAKSYDLISVSNGSLYLINSVITDYKLAGNHAIDLPSGNYARYLYMANSTMSNLKATEAGGIFCSVYGGNNSNASKSRVYIHNSEFYECSTSGGNTVGGSAIRSYAADRCIMQVKKSTFRNNTCTATGQSSGGGAIYWKSAEGKAVLIECEFTGNSATKVGGAIYNTGEMSIQKCTFKENKATGSSEGSGCGGAIAVEPPYTSSKYTMNYQGLDGSLTLDKDTVISDNTAKNHGGGLYFNAFASQIGSPENDGTQIMIFQMTLEINGATIEKNKAKYGGGIAMWLNYKERNYTTGIYINESSTIANNEATVDGGAVWMSSAEDCDCLGNSGVVMNSGTLDNNKAVNGGAIFIDTGKPEAKMNFDLKGGTVSNNKATENGGAAYITGGSVTMEGGTVTQCQAIQSGGAICVANGSFSISGGSLANCSAEKDGGAVYVSGGNAAMSGGTITECTANANGGAVCVDGGAFTIQAGTIEKTVATLGGAVYVSGGNANVYGGTLTACKADKGGAIYVIGGTVTMLGGAITGNQATNGSGGAIYVTGTTGLQVIVQNGEISGNSASQNGGAISVVGMGETEEVTVQIGVNELHYDPHGTGAQPPCDHNGSKLDGSGSCPIVRNNVCKNEGGAIYISGSKKTKLNVYCITEEGNRGSGFLAGSKETSLSDFLKVDGGQVLISATNAEGNVYYGNSVINSSIHVTGGDLSLSGTLANPSIMAPITVDVVAAGGSYVDIRTNDQREGAEQYYVVKYFENFIGAGSATATGQYTARQTPVSVPHTVWGVIYSHPGVTIVGWNTKEDGNGKSFAVSSVINYGTEFTSEDLVKGITLELYAIWAENFYWIKFDPNADNYVGTMGTTTDGKQSFLCAAQSTELPKNKYVNLSKKFLGWALTSDAKKPDYTDGQEIAALTQEVGEVITFYAVWEICNHTEENKFVFVKSSDGSSMTCTCQCAYVVTATIVAPQNAIFNSEQHPARLTFTNNSNNSFTENHISAFSGYTILYAYTPFDPNYKNDENVNTDAGSYTASVTINEFTISVPYTVAKATQSAPEKPTFKALGSTLTVNAPSNSVGQAGTTVHYKLVHNEEKKEISSDPQTDRVFNNFSTSWTLYYVVAYFPETNNYLQSDEIVSEQKFIFQGEINIIIENNPGIAVTQPQEFNDESGKVALISKSKSDYYLSSDYGAILVTGILSNGTTSLDMSDPDVFSQYFKRVTPNDSNEIHEFAYVVHPFAEGYKGDIKITFTGAKQKPTTATSIAPNEQFGDVTNTATTVAKDSAFTAYFELNYFDLGVYSNLTLSFDSILPSNATIIMVDKANGSYWYSTGGSASIAISSFKRMGGGEGSPAISEALRYQFIIDFSDTSMDASTLGVKLTADASDIYAPVLQQEWKIVTLANVTHSLQAPVASGNVANTEMQYIQGAEHASKWTDREVALVLTPAGTPVLPIDASIQVVETIGTQTKTTVCMPDGNGNFVVTLDPNATKLQITLLSQMFQTNTFTFTLRLYAAYEGDAPMNGILLATHTDVTFESVAKVQNSAKITVDRASRIYDISNNDVIRARIDVVVGEGYTATVTLLHKNKDGVFTSTGWSESLENETTQIEIMNLDSFQEGVLCLSVVVREDSSNTAVLTVPYYLIIQKSRVED